MSRKKKSKVSSRTQMIHGKSDTTAWEFSRHVIPPITSNTTFRLESLKRGAQGFISFASDESGSSEKEPILIYDRLDEPNTMMLEEQLAQMESAECAITFGSGMGAISSSILALTKTGQKIIAHRTLYGCTYSLLTSWLPRLGVETTFIDINDPKGRKKFDDPSVRIVYFESLSNPSLDLADIPKIIKEIQSINKKRKPEERIITIVDNTFATPWGLRPIEFGVDVVIQSLTKNISGFGTEMGGAIMTRKEFEKPMKLARKDFGAILNPRSAWNIAVYGVSTLALRHRQQQENALKIAAYLEKHKKVERVIYPGLKSYSQAALAKKLLRTPEGEFSPGTMISFTVKGDMKKCEKLVDYIATHSYSITLAVSLGITKTLIEVPGYMTHSAIPADKQSSSGIDPRSIRLSLGIENAEDLIADLEEALASL